MVKGLDLFKKHFASFQQNYSLIGGVACMLAFEKAGLAFRATRDLDIVVFVEALDRRFATAFWDFIKQGNYESRQRSTGKKLFYRFHNPSHSSYPDIIELFSRASAKVFHREGSHLTPIPITEEISSLSAILLNDDYYQFIHDGKMAIDGISIINPAHIIPLKAKAYLDLSAQAKGGAHVDEKDIRKHRNDILRLHQLLSPATPILLPKSIRQDMQEFLDQIEDCSLTNLKDLGLKNTNLSEVLSIIKQIYCSLEK